MSSDNRGRPDPAAIGTASTAAAVASAASRILRDRDATSGQNQAMQLAARIQDLPDADQGQVIAELLSVLQERGRQESQSGGPGGALQHQQRAQAPAPGSYREEVLNTSDQRQRHRRRGDSSPVEDPFSYRADFPARSPGCTNIGAGSGKSNEAWMPDEHRAQGGKHQYQSQSRNAYVGTVNNNRGDSASTQGQGEREQSQNMSGGGRGPFGAAATYASQQHLREDKARKGARRGGIGSAPGSSMAETTGGKSYQKGKAKGSTHGFSSSRGPQHVAPRGVATGNKGSTVGPQDHAVGGYTAGRADDSREFRAARQRDSRPDSTSRSHAGPGGGSRNINPSPAAGSAYTKGSWTTASRNVRGASSPFGSQRPVDHPGSASSEQEYGRRFEALRQELLLDHEDEEELSSGPPSYSAFRQEVDRYADTNINRQQQHGQDRRGVAGPSSVDYDSFSSAGTTHATSSRNNMQQAGPSSSTSMLDQEHEQEQRLREQSRAAAAERGLVGEYTYHSRPFPNRGAYSEEEQRRIAARHDKNARAQLRGAGRSNALYPASTWKGGSYQDPDARRYGQQSQSRSRPRRDGRGPAGATGEEDSAIRCTRYESETADSNNSPRPTISIDSRDMIEEITTRTSSRLPNPPTPNSQHWCPQAGYSKGVFSNYQCDHAHEHQNRYRAASRARPKAIADDTRRTGRGSGDDQQQQQVGARDATLTATQIERACVHIFDHSSPSAQRRLFEFVVGLVQTGPLEDVLAMNPSGPGVPGVQLMGRDDINSAPAGRKSKDGSMYRRSRNYSSGSYSNGVRIPRLPKMTDFPEDGAYPGTSVMLRNIPNRLTPNLLLNLLFSNNTVLTEPDFHDLIHGTSLVGCWQLEDGPIDSDESELEKMPPTELAPEADDDEARGVGEELAALAESDLLDVVFEDEEEVEVELSTGKDGQSDYVGTKLETANAAASSPSTPRLPEENDSPAASSPTSAAGGKKILGASPTAKSGSKSLKQAREMSASPSPTSLKMPASVTKSSNTSSNISSIPQQNAPEEANTNSSSSKSQSQSNSKSSSSSWEETPNPKTRADYEHLRALHEMERKKFSWDQFKESSRVDPAFFDLRKPDQPSTSPTSSSSAVEQGDETSSTHVLIGPWSKNGSIIMATSEVLDPVVAQFVDFMDLPQNIRGVNLGYAFLHFRSRKIARKFVELMNGVRCPGKSEKTFELVITTARHIPYMDGMLMQNLKPTRTMFWFDEESMPTILTAAKFALHKQQQTGAAHGRNRRAQYSAASNVGGANNSWR
ncbi:unnamed protein product [Amoebophrya sp. A120]|nr:unnamed protein product [Amoebophrya sp. A120]|eukprot:GSA120T00017992001.1